MGADVFRFTNPDHSGATLATADRIRDFSLAQGDSIQLQLIDADSTTAGGQAFSFIGSAAFGNVAGQLRFEIVGGNTILQADRNGDGIADFLIRIDGVHMLTEDDFIL